MQTPYQAASHQIRILSILLNDLVYLRKFLPLGFFPENRLAFIYKPLKPKE
jgi:hypothetical protein